ncbi:MAG: DUF1697 domain-containing protein [Chthoniobacterales bacterium]|nr:DUF1697 domain-containing protein [Chthoniobacterales bacterium]
MNLGKRRLPMSQLKELFEELGLAEVETFIASGNACFRATKKTRVSSKRKSRNTSASHSAIR